jgi:hypothetical protein
LELERWLEGFERWLEGFERWLEGFERWLEGLDPKCAAWALGSRSEDREAKRVPLAVVDER